MTRNVGTLDSVPPDTPTGTPLAQANRTHRRGHWLWTRSALRDLV